MTQTQSPESRLKDVLAHAVELSAAERSAYIDEAAGADTNLRNRLRELVAAWDQATTMLRDPTQAARISGAERAFRTEGVGDRVGAFTLGEKIGEGGFGVVYRATQEAPVRREVALKLLRPGAHSDSVIARFDAERQALARLTHPSIARIFDAGAAPSGAPFFAMELVEGAAITKYCEQRRLDLRARLRLFIKVCLAVQHAHAKGIIHRDLKPSNLLVADVDREATPKIIDFGIAKAIDEPLTDVSMITLVRQVIGTPRYMPPEQASLDPAAVDTRSDVYSLGVVLYELLTGDTPLTEDMVRSMRVGDLSSVLYNARFPTPSERLRARRAPDGASTNHRASDAERLSRAVRGELDWIVMRAIEPEPARRYQTALAFARDIERYLSDEPIDARPTGRVYLARKFVRRHRLAVTAGAMMGLALIGALGASRWALDRVERAQGRTKAALGQLQEEQARTQAALADAQSERDVAKSALNEAEKVTDFLSRLIASVDPDERGKDVRVAEMLDDAAADLSSGKLEVSDAVRGRLHHVLGNAYWALGVWPKAEAQLREAVAFRAAVYGPDHPALLSSQSNLASLIYEKGEVDAALTIMEGLIDRAGRAYTETNQTYLGLLGNYALMLNAKGRSAEARAIEERLVTLTEQVFGADHERTIGAIQNLAGTLITLNQPDEAERLFLDAIARGERGPGIGAHATVIARQSLAAHYLRTGRADQALPLMRQVLEERTRIHGPRHPNTLLSVYNIGAAYLQTGAPDAALEPMSEVLWACPEILPVSHPLITAAMGNLPLIFEAIGWESAPADLIAHVTGLIRQAAERDLPMQTANSFAMLLVSVRPISPDDAALAVRLAERVCAQAEAESDPFLYGFLDTLALARESAGDLPNALIAAQRAVDHCPAEDDAARIELGQRLESLRAAVYALDQP